VVVAVAVGRDDGGDGDFDGKETTKTCAVAAVAAETRLLLPRSECSCTDEHSPDTKAGRDRNICGTAAAAAPAAAAPADAGDSLRPRTLGG